MPAISTALSRCKKSCYILQSVTSRPRRVTLKAAAAGTTCTFSNTSVHDGLVLLSTFISLPTYVSTQDVQTRWNSTHDIIKRACEQQPAIVAVLHRRQDLTHLEISSGEWRILEDIADFLEPYKDATTYLSSESYPTISALGPLFNEIRSKVISSDGDSTAVRQFKNALAADMDKRYQDPDVSLVLNKASFLDSQFKSLAHLPSCISGGNS